MIMKCIKCEKSLSGGDITIGLIKGKERWVVRCPSCDTVQPFVVLEDAAGMGFIVVLEK